MDRVHKFSSISNLGTNLSCFEQVNFDRAVNYASPKNIGHLVFMPIF